MDVDEPESRDLEQLRRKDPAVGDDDPDVRSDARDFIQELRVLPQPIRPRDSETEGGRRGSDRGTDGGPMPAHRAVGPGDDELDGLPGLEDGLEGRHGERGGPEEDDAQSAPAREGIVPDPACRGIYRSGSSVERSCRSDRSSSSGSGESAGTALERPSRESRPCRSRQSFTPAAIPVAAKKARARPLTTPKDTLKELLAKDEGREVRQVAMIDAKGTSGLHR